MKRLTLAALILAGIAFVASAQSMSATSSSSSGSTSGMMASEDPNYAALKKANMLADVAMGMQLRNAMSTGMKVSFKDLMAAEALAAKNPTVLFFAADWCPSCQADLKDINANGSRLGKTNVVVVDYDKSADLKARYGVTMQDTYVQIGAMGEKIAIWNGGGVDGLLMNVKKPM